MAAGMLTFLLASWFYPDLEGDVIGFVVSMLTMFIVAPLTQKLDPPKILTDEYGDPISLDDRLGVLPFFGGDESRRG